MQASLRKVGSCLSFPAPGSTQPGRRDVFTPGRGQLWVSMRGEHSLEVREQVPKLEPRALNPSFSATSAGAGPCTGGGYPGMRRGYLPGSTSCSTQGSLMVSSSGLTFPDVPQPSTISALLVLSQQVRCCPPPAPHADSFCGSYGQDPNVCRLLRCGGASKSVVPVPAAAFAPGPVRSGRWVLPCLTLVTQHSCAAAPPCGIGRTVIFCAARRFACYQHVRSAGVGRLLLWCSMCPEP